MKSITQSPLVIACTFLWIGFISAISFMEAPLKFQAPGITLPLGLGIGRLIFASLNKVEWVLATGIVSGFLLTGARRLQPGQFVFIVPLLILIVQTVWLLPKLDAQAALYIRGEHPATSDLHIYYLICEVAKATSLTIGGVKQFSVSLK